MSASGDIGHDITFEVRPAKKGSPTVHVNVAGTRLRVGVPQRKCDRGEPNISEIALVHVQSLQQCAVGLANCAIVPYIADLEEWKDALIHSSAASSFRMRQQSRASRSASKQ